MLEDYHQLLADEVVKHAEKLGRLVDYIETGVCTGNSAEAVLSTGKVRYAVLVDPFPNNYCGHIISAAAVEHRLEKYEGLFRVVQGDSRDVLPTIIEKFDVGFVDGDHSKEGCLFDMQQMDALLRGDGVMFVDDLNGSGLDATVRQFATDNDWTFVYHTVHEGLGELRRKT